MDDKLRTEFKESARTDKGDLERIHRAVGKQAIARMQVGPDAHVLDVGCGSGWAAQLLAGLAINGHVTGIDISDEMVRVAREASNSYKNLDFQVANAEQLPFKDNEFTHAVSIESLYYFNDIQGAIGEVHRVLKPGGMFMAVVDLYQENEPTNYWIEKLSSRVHQLAIADYHTLFRRSGFIHVRDERLVDPTPPTDEFSPKWFESKEAYLEYRENGSLMMTGFAEK